MAWNASEHNEIVKMLAAVCEVTNTQFSDLAKQLMLKQLGAYPARQVYGALRRCADECRYRITLADVIGRLDDGRPGAEEAWAKFPKDEQQAACVTEEMAAAWGAAQPLMAAGDHVAARMAFRETYDRRVREARAKGEEPKWFLSAGWDKALTEAAAIEGVKSGVLAPELARNYLAAEKLEALLLGGPTPVPTFALLEASRG